MKIWWSKNVEFIKPYGFHHYMYISIFVISLYLLIKNRNKIKENSRKLRFFILFLSLFQQILLYSWYYLETGFNLGEALPLHICRISTLLGIWFLITKNTKVLDTMFYFGLYAYGSFLYPSRVYPVYHAVGISFVINHIITIILPWFAYIAYGWKPKLKALKKSSLIFLIYFVFVYFLNPIIDGNYFYLKYRPFFKTWPEYIYVPFLVIGTLLGFYLAYTLADKLLPEPTIIDSKNKAASN